MTQTAPTRDRDAEPAPAPAGPVIDRLLDLAALPGAALPDASRRMAALSLYDWMLCGLGGVEEPVARALRAHLAAEGGAPAAAILGGGRGPARAAALANGATSHALDYDDTHFAHIGHLSVGIYPAALAVGEETGAAAQAVVDAFLVGAEAAIRVGLLLGRAHYDRGFHQTATAGAFGATVAAGRLYGLTRAQMRAALGLCATRASGLKGQFGTMGKPLNAGIAAANGVECAALARAGLTSADDGLEGVQGFVATHSDAPDRAAVDALAPGQFLFDDVRYKLHACCHGTHAMIEGLRAAPLPQPDEVAEVRLRTHPRWLSVCDIKAPRTGLEVKFSYAWIAAMVLEGRDTGAERSFDTACTADPGLARLAARVTVTADPALSDLQAVGEVVPKGAAPIPFARDLGVPVAPAALESGLRAKGAALLGAARAEALWHLAQDPQGHSARDIGAALGG